MNLETLLNRLSCAPETVEFVDVMAVIEANYAYQPAAFNNGLGDSAVLNAAGTNEGSCKIFAFARIQGLNQADTLACFGHYYRQDVLENSDGDNHQNIRQFMLSGWDGIEFTSQALIAK